MEQTNKRYVYWCKFSHEHTNIYIAATSKGLCYVGSSNGSFNEMTEWLQKRQPLAQLVHDERKIRLLAYTIQLQEYFCKRRTRFDFALDLYGTDFQLLVWQALNGIPYGSTFSYSQIAERLGKPTAVRAVAAAIGANPVLIGVPCHRVIGKSGTLTGYRGGLKMKASLLELEQQGAHAEGAVTYG